MPEGMIFVPAGAFNMGSSKGDIHNQHDIRLFSDAQPEHKVNVPAFYLDKTEVTNAQYKKYCDATGYPAPPHWKNGQISRRRSRSACDARELVGSDGLCQMGRANAYPPKPNGKKPHAAPMVAAIRGRMAQTGQPLTKPELSTGESKPQPVGQKPAGASPYGALDMAGNVFEWVADWYEAYPNSTQKLPEFGKQFKVMRGGGFDSLPGFPVIYNVAYRSVAKPQTRSEWIGFRCAQDQLKLRMLEIEKLGNSF